VRHSARNVHPGILFPDYECTSSIFRFPIRTAVSPFPLDHRTAATRATTDLLWDGFLRLGDGRGNGLHLENGVVDERADGLQKSFAGFLPLGDTIQLHLPSRRFTRRGDLPGDGELPQCVDQMATFVGCQQVLLLADRVLALE